MDDSTKIRTPRVASDLAPESVRTTSADPVWNRRLWLASIPAALVVAVFDLFLGHRHDYAGHFAAGYGGTFGAQMVWLKGLAPERRTRSGRASVLFACGVCILIGVFTESTAFRLAKFDEFDFFSQSLGATLASLAALDYLAPASVRERFTRRVARAVGYVEDFGLSSCPFQPQSSGC